MARSKSLDARAVSLIGQRYPKGVVGLVLFALLMTPLLLGLGGWQLDRAEEKQRQLSQQRQGSAVTPTHLDELPSIEWRQLSPTLRDQWQFTPLKVTGRYDPSVYLLLDNRTRHGQVGYEVLSLFKTRDGQPLLINRGWIKAPLYRDQWPTIHSETAEVSMMGSVYFPEQQTFVLASELATHGWPKRIQALDIEAVARELGMPLLPFTLRLSNDQQTGAFQTGWQLTQISPDKHRGYAAQWFALAGVLVVMTVLAIRTLMRGE